jgi:group I intron endonuclease
MEHVIYKLTSPSGKMYIGRTRNFNTRMADHKHNALVKNQKNSLYKAIRKYGWDTFTKEIIATVVSEESAQLLEEMLIQKFNSVKCGYNDTYVGGGGDLLKNQPEKIEKFKKKMSEITSGEKNGMYGKKQTEDAKQKQREKAKGRFSLQWYIDRYGNEEGKRLYTQRSENLRSRKLLRNEQGVFIPSN